MNSCSAGGLRSLLFNRKFAATLLLFLVGCAGETTSPRMSPDTVVRAARPVNYPPISLLVTVSDTDGAGNPYYIQSDGQGVYTDGLQNVQAVLDQNGTFAFNTTNRRAATRWVSYNFNNPVDPSNTYRPTPSNLENYHFSTGASPYTPYVAMQNLGVNGNPDSECIYMGNSIANSTTQWRVSFHKGLEDTANSSSAYAVITRSSVTPAVWTITPSGACSPVSNVAALRSGDASVLYGYYNIPFFFTIRAK